MTFSTNTFVGSGARIRALRTGASALTGHVLGDELSFGLAQTTERLAGGSGVAATKELQGPDIQAARLAVQKAQRQIAKAVNEGDQKRARALAYRLFRSWPVRLASASYALRRTSATEAEVRGLAEMISAASAPEATATVGRVLKFSGAYRYIVSFAPLDRARQMRVLLSFGQLVEFHPQQFGVPGRGRDDAVSQVVAALPHYRWAAELDIKNFFGSVTAHALQEEFGLREWMVQDVLTMTTKEGKGRVKYEWDRPTDNECLTICRRLPQGSCASPVFAYGLLRRAIAEFISRHPEVQLVNYADNFLLLGPTSESVRAAQMTLTMLLREQSACALTLLPKYHPQPISRGFTFLGYRFTSRAGACKVTIAAERKHRFEADLSASLRSLKHARAEIRTAALGLLCKQIEGFVAGYKLAPQDALALTAMLDRALRLYRRDPAVCALMNRLARRLPSQDEIEQNRNIRPKITPLQSRYGIASDGVNVPASFSVSRVHQHVANTPFLLRMLNLTLGPNWRKAA